jgi:ribosome-binding protein aMBF1 (putative translation factor)
MTNILGNEDSKKGKTARKDGSVPNLRLTTSTTPSAVTGLVHELGARIAAARKRRRWRTADLAARAGITRETLRRLEQGELGTSLGVCFTVLWALGLHEDVAILASAERDTLGRTMTDARLGTRIRPETLDDDF